MDKYISVSDFVSISDKKEHHIYDAEEFISIFNSYSDKEREDFCKFITIMGNRGYFDGTPDIHTDNGQEILTAKLGNANGSRSTEVRLVLDENLKQLCNMILCQEMRLSFNMEELMFAVDRAIQIENE